MSSCDFEDIGYEDEEAPSRRPDDFISMVVDNVYEFDWVMLFCVAISFIFIMSDIFNERVLSKIEGTITNSQEITTYGYMIQLVSLLIATVISKMMLSMAKS